MAVVEDIRSGRSRPAETRRRGAVPLDTGEIRRDLPVPALWIILFVLSLVQGGFLLLGGTVVGAARGLMLIALVPVIAAYAMGKGGQVRLPDIAILLFVLWQYVCTFVNHPDGSRTNLTVATSVETLVPYFMARVLIRNERSFRFLFRCLLVSLLFIVPFAAMESLTGRNILSEVYNQLPGIEGFRGTTNPPRLGLERADSVFEHPILYGLYCALPFSMAWMATFPNASMAVRGFWAGLCMLGMVFSVSTGAILMIMMQGMLIGWNWVMGAVAARWKLLLAGFCVLYLLAAAISESPPLLYMVSKMALSADSAWNRVNIWEHGSANVRDNPIFGLAFRPWERPGWLLPSVDNFWLLMAMRYGYPGFIFLVTAVGWHFVTMVRKNLAAYPEINQLRLAYLFTLLSVYVMLATVHIWSASYMLVIFLLGAGAWILELPETPAEPDAADPGDARSGSERAAAAAAAAPGKVHYNRDHLRPSGRSRRPTGVRR